MEEGILFARAGEAAREYRKSFCFAETPKSAFWDRNEQADVVHEEVTREEARIYDEIMEKVISVQFF